MTTRYSALVSLKKKMMQKAQRVVIVANESLQNAKSALEGSYRELENLTLPANGRVSDMVSFRALMDAQRAMIKHNEEWLRYAQKELVVANERLKSVAVEYEKFAYLEFKELELKLLEQKKREAKELDEIALIGFNQKEKRGELSV